MLANPAKIDQESGIKHAHDKNDAYFLAELQWLNILPTGYIYDPELPARCGICCVRGCSWCISARPVLM